MGRYMVPTSEMINFIFKNKLTNNSKNETSGVKYNNYSKADHYINPMTIGFELRIQNNTVLGYNYGKYFFLIVRLYCKYNIAEF